MEQKAFQLSEVKTDGTKGEFEALVSVFGNVDSVGDRVHPGAFTKAISEQEPPPIYYAHNWLNRQPPIGQSLAWSEKAEGLVVKGKLFVDEDDHHALADMVYAGMKQRPGVPAALSQFSFAYDVEDSDYTFEQKSRVRELKSIFPVHEIGPCPKGVNSASALLNPPKSLLDDATVLSSTEEKDVPSSLLIGMLDQANTYLSATNDPEQLKAIKQIANNVISLLQKDFSDQDAAKEAEQLALDLAVKHTDLAWRFPPLHALN